MAFHRSPVVPQIGLEPVSCTRHFGDEPRLFNDVIHGAVELFECRLDMLIGVFICSAGCRVPCHWRRCPLALPCGAYFLPEPLAEKFGVRTVSKQLFVECHELPFLLFSYPQVPLSLHSLCSRINGFCEHCIGLFESDWPCGAGVIIFLVANRCASGSGGETYCFDVRVKRLNHLSAVRFRVVIRPATSQRPFRVQRALRVPTCSYHSSRAAINRFSSFS